MEIDWLVRRAGAQRFRIYVPPDYDESQPLPAVLFLHGAGERGSDSLRPVKVGIGPALERRAQPYRAIVIFPQCPRDQYWSSPAARAVAIAALDATTGEFNIDADRIALTGISMGGNGAWLLAGDSPDRFMSLAPICGWLTTRDAFRFAAKIAHVPTWIVHGDADDIVPVDASRVMAEALEAAGGDYRYTELRGVAHNSWDRAYQKSDLMDWLLEPGSDARQKNGRSTAST